MHARPLIRNEEVLTDLLSRIRLTGTPDNDQLMLMHELVKLAHDDTELFVNLQPAEKKAEAVAAYERCREILLARGGRERIRAVRENACEV
ncbi:MAG TPA: hypothetical protein VN397_03565 [Candidatus Methylomirabilis sp.]|nr:hypothetical protein [Candidatus Methylomirabilis sp.]